MLYVKQTGLVDKTYFMMTDHLGSVVKILDESRTTKFAATYDAWGNQTVTQNDIGFHRGYTGHEMLPEFGLINMNGRLYDPAIGRFLSTDSYVQEPGNSQNFNRYSYCLNNPLKYTDPSGEIPLLSVFTGFVKGVIKLISGKGKWYDPIYYAYKDTANDFKTIWGLYKGTPLQIISRFTWELPQTVIGYGYTSWRFLFSDIDKVQYFDGATYIIDKTKKNDNGVTLGNFININSSDDIPKDNSGNFAPYLNKLYAHEYGHYLQSQSSGWIYLFKYGIPSLWSAIFNTKRQAYGNGDVSLHHLYWTEKDANGRAFKYYKKKGYMDEWNFWDYPLP